MYSVGARCVLIYPVRACDMNACCRLGPSKYTEAKNKRGIKTNTAVVPTDDLRCVPCGTALMLKLSLEKKKALAFLVRCHFYVNSSDSRSSFDLLLREIVTQ